jgi:hypothetical protein
MLISVVNFLIFLFAKVAMSAPTSVVAAETCLRHMEHKQMYPILIKPQITGYFRYVSDILIIYDQKKTNTKQTLDEFDELQHFIKLTIEKELHNSINFLDLTIHHEDKNVKFSIYRKPTQTDIIIHNSSCYTYEQKLSSIMYLLIRIHTHPVTKEARETQLNTMRNIVHNKQYKIIEIKKTWPTKTKYVQ